MSASSGNDFLSILIQGGLGAGTIALLSRFLSKTEHHSEQQALKFERSLERVEDRVNEIQKTVVDTIRDMSSTQVKIMREQSEQTTTLCEMSLKVHSEIDKVVLNLEQSSKKESDFRHGMNNAVTVVQGQVEMLTKVVSTINEINKTNTNTINEIRGNLVKIITERK